MKYFDFFCKYRRYLIKGLAIVALLLFLFLAILHFTRKNELSEAADAAYDLYERYDVLSVRYAELLLRSIDLQEDDCYICSAEGISTDNTYDERGKLIPGPDCKMYACVISASPIKSRTIPINVTIYSCNYELNELKMIEKTFKFDADLKPVTDILYTACFKIPRSIIPDESEVFLKIKCGNGKKYRYLMIIDRQIARPFIFMVNQYS